MDSKLPTAVLQFFACGKHQTKGKKNIFLRFIEMPRSLFRVLYIFGSSIAISSLYYMAKGILFEEIRPNLLIYILDFLEAEGSRKVEVDSTWGLVAMFFFTMQVCRRLYEVYFVQIFSSKQKMNIFYFAYGLAHYFFVPMAILAYTEGFVRGYFNCIIF